MIFVRVKRLSLIIIGCLALCVGFVYIYIRKIDPDELRRLLVFNVEGLLDANFEVEKLEFSGLKSFGLTNVGLYRHGKPLLKIRQADVNLSLTGLLRSRLEFSSLKLDGVDVYLRSSDGGWNFRNLILEPTEKTKSQHRAFLSLGDDSGRGITIASLHVINGILHKDELEPVSFAGSGSLKFPELHLPHLRVESANSSVLARLDAHFSNQAVNVWFNNSTLALGDIRDYLQLGHSLTGLVHLEGGVRWNHDEIDPQLRWRSEKISWKRDQLEVLLSYLEGQWDASGIYSLVKLASQNWSGDANLLVKAEPESLVWGNGFEGKILLQKMVIPGAAGPLGGELDFHKDDTRIVVKNLQVKSGPVDQLNLDGVYFLDSEQFGFNLRGELQQLQKYIPELAGGLTLSGKGAFSSIAGLELDWNVQCPDLLVSGRSILPLDFKIQSIYHSNEIQIPSLKVSMGPSGNLDFQGMFDLSKGFPAGINGRLSGGYLDLSSLTKLRSVQSHNSMEITEIGASIQDSMIIVHSLKGLSEEGEFSFRGSLGPLEKGLGLPHGKLRLTKMPLDWLHHWIPEKVRVDGILDTMGAFQVGIESPADTRLKLTGTLSSVGVDSLEALNVLGSVDLSDLHSVLPSSMERLEGIVRLGVSQPDHNLMQGGMYSSKLQIPVNADRQPVQLEDVEMEFRLHKNPSLGRIKKFTGKFFGGNYRLEGVYELEGQRTNQFNLDLNEVDLNGVLGFIDPSMRDHASGLLSGRVGFMSFLLPADRNTYPIVMDGFLGLARPTYTAHPLVSDLIFYVKRSANSGILHQILEPGAMGMLYEPPDLHFQDLERIPFTLSKDVLTFPELDIRSEKGEFHLISLAPLVLKFPGGDEPLGRVRGEFEIHLTNSFLRASFPRLKEDYHEDIKEKIRLEGTFEQPLLNDEIARLKQNIAQGIIRNSLPRPSKIPAEVEIARVEKNLLSQEERQRLRTESSEFLMKMLSPQKSSKLKDLVSGLVSRSQGPSITQSYTEVVDIENQIRNAREKLRTLLQSRF